MRLVERESHLRTAAAYLADAAAGHGGSSSSRVRPGSARPPSCGRSRRTPPVSARVGHGHVRRLVDPGAARAAARDAARASRRRLAPGRAAARGLRPARRRAARASDRPSRTCSSSRTRTGPTRPPSTCCVHLARRVHTCRALVLVTYRPEDVPGRTALRLLMGEAATAAGVRRLDVGPLSGRVALALIPADSRSISRRRRATRARLAGRPLSRSDATRPAAPRHGREPVLRHRGARRRRRRAAADERARRRARPGRPGSRTPARAGRRRRLARRAPRGGRTCSRLCSATTSSRRRRAARARRPACSPAGS